MARNVLETRSNEVKTLSNDFQTMLANQSRSGVSDAENLRFIKAFKQYLVDVSNAVMVESLPDFKKCSRCLYWGFAREITPAEVRANGGRLLFDIFERNLSNLGRLSLTEEAQMRFMKTLSESLSKMNRRRNALDAGCDPPLQKCPNCGNCVSDARACTNPLPRPE